jgi:hypothetical protein
MRRVTIDPGATARTSHCQRRFLGSLLAALAATVFVTSAVGGAEWAGSTGSDEAAQGWQLGNSGLWVGGYINNTFELQEGGPDSVTLSDVGLLLRYQVTPTVSLFNETDLDESLVWQQGAGVQLGSRVLLLERLYADWQPRPDVTLRLGKFLTPFGLWNVVRRAPLTWTVDSPLIAESIFPEHITGVAVGFQTTQKGWTIDSTAYGQATDELYPGASDTVPSAAGGGRMSAGQSFGPAYLEVGASGVAFDNENTGHWQEGFGTDFACTAWGNYLQAEFAYGRQLTGGSDKQLGAYAQDAFPVVDGLWGVLRFEYFDPDAGGAVNGQLLGLAWRPLPWLFLKANYQFVNRSYVNLDRGFLAAVVMFF